MKPSYHEIEDKILSFESLLAKRKLWKGQGLTVVSNNGSYDIMHLGHVLGLVDAKRQGDILVVGLNSDKSVRAYKGPQRPINDESMRLRMLAALASVDYVFLFDETTPISWLERLKPEVHTNGAEYTEQCIEADTVIGNGGRLHLLPMIEGYKTTAIIDKIVSSHL